ncbi:hypothetical protein Lal_00039359 [Lupinus albus]|nr:hypothetical protein Lal_00039359 [Lupinus albus]
MVCPFMSQEAFLQYLVQQTTFSMIIDLLNDAYPHANLPAFLYEAKKFINLSYKKIHVCPNNCMLYWGGYLMKTLVVQMIWCLMGKKINQQRSYHTSNSYQDCKGYTCCYRV